MNIYTGWPKGSVSSFMVDGVLTPCVAYCRMSGDYVGDNLIDGVPEAPGCPDILPSVLCPLCGSPNGVILGGVYDGYAIRLVRCTCLSVFATTSQSVILYSMSDSCLAQLIQEDII